METYSSFGNNESQRFLPFFQDFNRDRTDSECSRSSDSWELSLRDDRTFMSIDVVTDSPNSLVVHGSPGKSIKSTPTNHQGVIAKALGLSLTERMLQFRIKTKSKDYLKKDGKKLTKSLMKENDYVAAKIKKVKEEVVAKKLRALCHVGATGLRNDFYSELVSWSTVNNFVILALGTIVYAWRPEDSKVEALMNSQDDPVSSVSCSSNGYIAVGSVQGKIHLICQSENNSYKSVCNTNGRAIHSIRWFADNSRLLAGDNSGDVLLFKVLVTNEGVELKILNILRCHKQLICGNYPPFKFQKLNIY